MCIDFIKTFFIYKTFNNKQTQTIDKKMRETFIQTENNNNNSISQTDLNMENLMEFSNEDWYKLVWTNPTWDKEQLIDLKN
jgi:hypothetical protein